MQKKKKKRKRTPHPKNTQAPGGYSGVWSLCGCHEWFSLAMNCPCFVLHEAQWFFLCWATLIQAAGSDRGAGPCQRWNKAGNLEHAAFCPGLGGPVFFEGSCSPEVCSQGVAWTKTTRWSLKGQPHRGYYSHTRLLSWNRTEAFVHAASLPLQLKGQGDLSSGQ